MALAHLSNVLCKMNFNFWVSILNTRKQSVYSVSSAVRKALSAEEKLAKTEKLERVPFKRYLKIMVTASSLSNADNIEVSFKNS